MLENPLNPVPKRRRIVIPQGAEIEFRNPFAAEIPAEIPSGDILAIAGQDPAVEAVEAAEVGQVQGVLSTPDIIPIATSPPLPLRTPTPPLAPQSIPPVSGDLLAICGSEQESEPRPVSAYDLGQVQAVLPTLDAIPIATSPPPPIHASPSSATPPPATQFSPAPSSSSPVSPSLVSPSPSSTSPPSVATKTEIDSTLTLHRIDSESNELLLVDKYLL